MEFPFSQTFENDVIVRTFSEEVDSDELKWHYDLYERFVVCGLKFTLVVF